MPKRQKIYTHRKRYNNPYFLHQKSSSFTWQVKAILGVIILALGFLGYVVFYSEILKITNIEVLGNQKISEEEIKYLVNNQLEKPRLLFLNQNNLLVFNKNQLIKTLNEEYLLESINVSKRPWHRLKVKIEEKTSVVTWVSNQRYYHVDLRGVAIEEIPQFIKLSEEPSSLVEEENIMEAEVIGEVEEEGETKEPSPEVSGEVVNLIGITIIDESNQPVSIGQNIVAPELIDFVVKLNEELPLKITTGIDYYKVRERGTKEITVMTLEGWEIYFNYELELKSQFKNLSLLLSEKIKDNTQGLKYIDLRWGERVYYR